MSHVIREADRFIDITDYLTVAYLIILDAPEMNWNRLVTYWNRYHIVALKLHSISSTLQKPSSPVSTHIKPRVKYHDSLVSLD